MGNEERLEELRKKMVVCCLHDVRWRREDTGKIGMEGIRFE